MSTSMDINQVAEYLGVSHKTVRRYVKAGKLKVKYVEGKGVYDQAEVEALKLDKQTPVHRVFPSVEEDIQLSQFVPPEIEGRIIHRQQGFEEYYTLRYLEIKLTLTIEECAMISGFSKAGLRSAVKSGTLKAIKYGGRWRVRSRDLEEYVKCLFGDRGHPHN
ncbi:MAG: helix-turn-helix domain-containing protein [Tolypothrix brevis GSE-NOS-MK-07-07A]|jgi:excisionase family DNA binding protein|nr:helix-turn-helix domain-containing protein [Tolypothrix brevis GSE-NOS-MK-07-07A]